MEHEVTLRPVTEDDLPVLERFAVDSEASGGWNWFGWRAPGQVRQRFAEDGYLGQEGGTLVVVADGETAVGSVGWRAVDYGPGGASRCWNIGVTLLPGWRGRGIGTAAQRLLAGELFATTLVERVEASTDVENLAERRSLEKAGFTYEGTLRRAQFRGGAWRDMAVYSLLRAEWRAVAGATPGAGSGTG